MLRLCALFVLVCTAAFAEVRGSVRVVDGDTIEVGNSMVRLFGVDAPEMDQTCVDDDGKDWACGTWAAGIARKTLEGREARCDVQTTDRHRRLVAICFVAGEDVGRVLVRSGVALAFRKYSMAYDLEEKSAAIERLGLHAGLFARPEDHRRAEAERRAARIAAQTPANNACQIKGNISASGRIYHLPGQEHYAKTSINETRGERWFCSEADAVAAGWRRAKR